MKPEQLRRNPVFTLLTEESADRHKAPVNPPIPTISRTGINIYFPGRHCEDYLNLLTREIGLKEAFLSTKGPVASLWLRGYPLRQLATHAITELVFRLCSRFNLKNNQSAERGIQLGPEYCDRNSLALLRGLGFEVIRLKLDATIAGPDRSTDAMRRAVEVIEEFCGLRLQCEILLSADTDPIYLNKLLAILMTNAAEEIELTPCTPSLHSIQDTLQCQKTLATAAQQLGGCGYRWLGEHCFKMPSHPDLLLRDNHKLCFGPWGFYSTDIVNWLGLGAAAEGISGGYLYHNIADLNGYRRQVLEDLNPVAGWSCKPLAGQSTYQLIQSLFCYHSLYNPCNDISDATLARLTSRGWLAPACESGEQLRLTPAGVENLGAVLQSVIGSSCIATNSGDQR